MGESDFETVGAKGLNLGQAQIIESELEELDGITPGTAAPSKCRVADPANVVRGGIDLGPSQVLAIDGAITIKHGSCYLTKGSAGAHTLAAPVAGTDDGKRLRVIAISAFAHVLTGPAGGFNAGGAGADVATFGGARGDGLDLEAYQGTWYVTRSTNIVLS